MILVLNFKTYLKTVNEHLNLIKKLKKIKGVNFWLALNPYFYLVLRKKIKGFKIGLQNLAPLREKPQTGEIVFDFELINKADFILIGHSERYRNGENKEIIKEKIKTLQDKNFKLLIFFSENSYKPKSKFSDVQKETEKNLNEFLKVIKKENYKKIFLVYEPWWAISSEAGKIPARKFLEDFLSWYQKNYHFPIFYGGSVNSEIINNYKNLGFNGYVLGKASINFNELRLIAKRS